MSAYPQPPPRTADSSTSSGRRGGSTTTERVRQKKLDVRRNFEDLIVKQDQTLQEHKERAVQLQVSLKERKLDETFKWREKAASMRKNRVVASAAKLAALEEREEVDEEYINTARSLADDYYEEKRVNNHALRAQYFEQRLKTVEEQGVKTVEELCLKHKFFLPSAKTGSQDYFTPGRQLVSADSARSTTGSARSDRGGTPSSSVRRPLLRGNEGLPSLIKAKEEPRQRAYEQRLRERQEETEKQREEREIRQVDATKRVKDLIEEATHRVKKDLKKKEAACVRVAKLMELKRNPRRTKAIERLVQTNPELWGPGE